VSLPVLTPEQHTKLLWIVGVVGVALLVAVVMGLAEPPTLEDGDAARARVDPRRRVRVPEWERRLWGMWLKGERKRLREARR
jgi:hypothetical protein